MTHVGQDPEVNRSIWPDRPLSPISADGESGEQEAAERGRPRRILAEVIQEHYGRRGRTRDREAPPLRLQDWRVVEEVSVGLIDYVLLRRVLVPRNGLDSLTARERDALRHACTGASNKEAAHEMGIAPSTVGVLLSRAYRKLGTKDRSNILRSLETVAERLRLRSLRK